MRRKMQMIAGKSKKPVCSCTCDRYNTQIILQGYRTECQKFFETIKYNWSLKQKYTSRHKTFCIQQHFYKYKKTPKLCSN